jgi:hypothetical protein
VKRMGDATRKLINGSVIALKILAMVAIIKPVLIRHASKAVTVFEQTFPGVNQPTHPKSYTYFSGFHVLNFSDIKWGVAIGVILYLAALGIQFAAATRLNPAQSPEGRQAF